MLERCPRRPDDLHISPGALTPTRQQLGCLLLAPCQRRDRDRVDSQSEGVTALVATHDPALIDLADSVLHLVDGKITA